MEAILHIVRGIVAKVGFLDEATSVRRRIPCGFLDMLFQHGLTLK